MTGPLAEARSGHTATTLLNGEVLVAGGLGSAGTLLGTSERYNDNTQTWASTGSPGTGWTAQYFFNGSSGTHLAESARDTRTDATIDFSTATGWPSNLGPLPSPQNFSVRWTGQLTAPATGTFTFYTTSDDGVRLKVNNQMLVDNWTDHGPTENSGTIALTAGQVYPVVLEYYQAAGGGSIKLEYRSSAAGVARQVIPASQIRSPFILRQDHTATLLPAGKVLVIGGRDGSGAPLASAQLYDPASGLWTNAGPLNTARYGHTATLLGDGRVLVVGGRNSASPEPLRSAEIYGAQDADIVVERPLNAVLAGGTTHDLGFTADSLSASFVIRNSGLQPLRGLIISVSGANASDFAVTLQPAPEVVSGGGTQFNVRFAPGTFGAKTANISIANNSPPVIGKAPYNITLTAQRVSDNTDTDGDGISDAQEWRMRTLGFNWQVRQPGLAAKYFGTASANGLYNQMQYNANYAAGQNAVINSPNTYNLYTLNQVHALNVDVPLLVRDTTGKFKLTMGLKKTASLAQPFVAFPMNQSGVTTVVNAQGKLEVVFPSTGNAAFFRVETP